jgi:hypothetical protein
MSYSPAWMNNQVRLCLPQEAQPVIGSYRWNVDIPADFMPAAEGRFDYLSLGFNYDLCEPAFMWWDGPGESSETLRLIGAPSPLGRTD